MAATLARTRKGKHSFKSEGERERFLKAVRETKGTGAPDAINQLRAMEKAKRVLRRRVPSSTWFDLHWHHGEKFPPPWDHRRVDPLKEPPASAMRACRICGRDTPPLCMSARDVCLDCQYADNPAALNCTLPGSCSKINLAALKAAAKAGRQYSGGF